MTVQVMNSKQEVEAYIAQMTGEEIPPAKAPAEAAETPADEPGTTEAPTVDPDDVEGDDGLTARQKRELSAKMLKAVGKKHREMKEAEEFAAAQYSERKLAERRAEDAERALADLKAKVQPDVSRETKESDPEAGKPKREAFQSDEAYWDAVIDWRADKRAEKILKDERAAQTAERERQRLADIESAARGRISRALELVPDFAAVTEAVDAEVPPVVAGYMQRSEMFAELGYYLAKNPDVLTRISKLPPDEQLVTIGKIEGTLKPFGSDGGSKASQTDGAMPSETTGKTGQQRQAAASEDTGIAPSRARDAAPVIRPINGNGAAAVEVPERDKGIREVIKDFSQRNKVDLRLRKRH